MPNTREAAAEWGRKSGQNEVRKNRKFCGECNALECELAPVKSPRIHFCVHAEG